MVEFTLPKNSRVTEGKTWPGNPGAKIEREFASGPFSPLCGEKARMRGR